MRPRLSSSPRAALLLLFISSATAQGGRRQAAVRALHFWKTNVATPPHGSTVAQGEATPRRRRKGRIEGEYVQPSSYWSSLRRRVNAAASLHSAASLFIVLFAALVIRERRKNGVAAADDAGASPSVDGVVDVDLDLVGSESSSTLSFENISFFLSSKKGKGEKRAILDGSISGVARPGRLLAIMGPSGSGKTSLMQAVAGRMKDSKEVEVSGERFFDGLPLASDSRVPAAFVKQEDNFFPYMTVRETLDFRVQLRLGSKLGRSAREDVVDNLMEKLYLTKSADTIVGNSKVRGISGGERKRLAIACEIISSPNVIFLDEPTSGLDSYQASEVVKSLRNMADAGKTIVAVIHQPSQSVFGMFDDLMLLSNGSLMYFGEVKDVRSYFGKLGYPCPMEVGTAEHVIDLISEGNGVDGEENAKDRIAKIGAAARPAASSIVAKYNGRGGTVAKRFSRKSTRPAAGVFKQFRLLLIRSFEDVFRGKAVLVIKIVQQVSTALIYGGIYNLGTHQSSIQDRIGLLSLIAIGSTNIGMAGTLKAFPREKAIVVEEVASGLYSILPYFLAKALAEIPVNAGLSALFGSILYPLVGLQRSRFLNFLGIGALHSLVAQSAGLFLGAASPTADVALALFAPFIVLNIIFDGKNIASENIPWLLRWIPKFGLIRWTFEALTLNEFVDLKFDSSGPRRGPIVRTGEEAVERLGFDEGATLQRAIQNQGMIIASCWTLSYLALIATKQKFASMKSKKKSKKD